MKFWRKISKRARIVHKINNISSYILILLTKSLSVIDYFFATSLYEAALIYKKPFQVEISNMGYIWSKPSDFVTERKKSLCLRKLMNRVVKAPNKQSYSTDWKKGRKNKLDFIPSNGIQTRKNAWYFWHKESHSYSTSEGGERLRSSFELFQTTDGNLYTELLWVSAKRIHS